MRALLGVCLNVVITGCGVGPVVEPVPTGPTPPFEDCVADEYLYVGESTLAALGLDVVTAAQVPAADANRVGRIWVTADFLPFDHGEPGGGDIERVRMFCVEFPDGSGMSSWPVDETWRPPGFSTETAGDASGVPPSAFLLVAVAAALLVVVSLIAFRGGR